MAVILYVKGVRVGIERYMLTLLGYAIIVPCINT